MENVFELNSIESKLDYIKISAPLVFERIQSELESGDFGWLKNEIIVGKALLEAFDLSGNDAIITTDIYAVPAIKKYLTKKSTVHISGKFEVVDNMCFSNCPALETIVFDEGVQCIKEMVLCNNSLVESIVFPKSLKFIGNNAFENCKKLSEVTFLNPKTWISPDAFKGTKWFENFEDDFVIVNGQLVKYNGKNENIVIPEGTVFVSESVFSENKFIKTVKFPSTLEAIWSFSFSNCTNIQSIVFNDNLKMICIGAFEGCENLKEVSLPKNLEELGAMAFNRNTVINFYNANEELAKHIKDTYPSCNIIY